MNYFWIYLINEIDGIKRIIIFMLILFAFMDFVLAVFSKIDSYKASKHIIYKLIYIIVVYLIPGGQTIQRWINL